MQQANNIKGDRDMKIKFLLNITTLDELKKGFRVLAFKFHPDKGGNIEDMQQLNNEYSFLSEKLSVEGKKFNDNINPNGGYTRYKDTETTEQAQQYKDIIEKLINCIGLEIEICGTWIWVGGETKEHKELLKSLGFKWARVKKMWSFGERKGKAHKTWDMDKIRDSYGSTRFNPNNKPILE